MQHTLIISENAAAAACPSPKAPGVHWLLVQADQTSEGLQTRSATNSKAMRRAGDATEVQRKAAPAAGAAKSEQCADK